MIKIRKSTWFKRTELDTLQKNLEIEEDEDLKDARNEIRDFLDTTAEGEYLMNVVTNQAGLRKIIKLSQNYLIIPDLQLADEIK
ncbi:MAG: hypothetical protein XE08_0215 [Parcubacteria bacterium 32_520]|nr:MAG: hypothetical protein XE08_0215 [Parcubacteria bacterium 32_520]